MEDRRRVPRYIYQGTGNLVASGRGTAQEVSMVSLCVDGCRVLGANLPSRGERCELVLPGHTKEFRTFCHVAWKGSGTAGLRFESVDEANFGTLKEICSELTLEPLVVQPPPTRQRG
jgi:PilZ domain